MGHAIIMGKKTAVILGKPLLGRINYVLTHKDKSSDWLSFVSRNNDTKFIEIDGESLVGLMSSDPDFLKDAFVIGGEYTYYTLFPYIDEVYATEVYADLQGDQFFPAFEDGKWITAGHGETITIQHPEFEEPIKYRHVVYRRLSHE